MKHGLAQTILKISSVEKGKQEIGIFRNSTSIHDHL